MKARPSPNALGVFYFTSFSVLGIYLPYFNLYARSLGLGGAQIGILAAAIPLGKMVFGPLWTLWADRIGARKGMAVASAGLATAVFAGMLRADTFLPMCAILYAYSAVLSPLLPLVEATTLELSDRWSWQYGRIRLWGSVGFIATAVAAGPLLDTHPLRMVVPAVLVASALNFAATAAIPRTVPAATWGRADLRPALLRAPVLGLFACTLLMQASHGGYYAFFSIVLEDAGFRRGTIGALWALGVICEIVTMSGSAWLLRRLGVSRLITLGLVLAVVRWTVYANTLWLPAVIGAQVLHAFTFGAFHVAAVTGTHRLFPESLRSSGQSLYSGLTYGVGNAIGFFGAGLLFQWGGGARLFGLSAIAAAGAAGISFFLWRERALGAGAAPAPESPGAGGGLE